MTEVQTTMVLEEFQQHHTRTWDYVARIGKVWEAIAEEQQAIIDGKGYRHLGYSSHKEYWNTEFAKMTGWAWSTLDSWLVASRTKRATPIAVDRDLTPARWNDLGGIKDPAERVEFLERYETELKPKLKEEGVDSHVFREAIKEFKGERGVIDHIEEEGVVVPPYPSGPSPAQRAYDNVSRLRSVAMDVQPEDAARSIGHSGVAAGVASDYEFLIPWVRRFVAELKLYGEGA
jgi:hypothetical protein